MPETVAVEMRVDPVRHVLAREPGGVWLRLEDWLSLAATGQRFEGQSATYACRVSVERVG